MNKFFEKLVPFLLLGMAIVAFVFGLLLLTYLFLFGAAVGLVLFLITWIRQRFFGKKEVISYKVTRKKGRVIDSDDWKSM